MNVLISLFKNQSGVTAIEYSLIAALIAVAAIASMTTIGASISTTFQHGRRQALARSFYFD
jgi:pilus assembly protein Flp/PilA